MKNKMEQLDDDFFKPRTNDKGADRSLHLENKRLDEIVVEAEKIKKFLEENQEHPFKDSSNGRPENLHIANKYEEKREEYIDRLKKNIDSKSKNKKANLLQIIGVIEKGIGNFETLERSRKKTVKNSNQVKASPSSNNEKDPVENNGKKNGDAGEPPVGLSQDEINVLAQPFEEKKDEEKKESVDEIVKKEIGKTEDDFLRSILENGIKNVNQNVVEMQIKSNIRGFSNKKNQQKKKFPSHIRERFEKLADAYKLSDEFKSRLENIEDVLEIFDHNSLLIVKDYLQKNGVGRERRDEIVGIINKDYSSELKRIKECMVAENNKRQWFVLMRTELGKIADEVAKKIKQAESSAVSAVPDKSQDNNKKNKIEEDYRDIEDNENRWTTPDSEGDSLTDEEIEKQVLKRKKEKIEKEIEELEIGAFHVNEKMRLRGEIGKIEEQIEFLEKGGKIPESKGKDLTPEDEKQFQKEIEQMPAEERKKVGFGLRNMGFFAREFKSRKLAELCEFASKKSKGNKFLAALAETYRKDEDGARKQIEDSDKKIKGMQQLQNVGYITGGALKWGRTVADFAGWTVGSPLRYVTLGAQFFSRGAEAAKEARFKNEKVINKTRIKDIDQAAEEAWNLYGQAKVRAAKNGEVTAESLDKAYAESLPEDLLKRLKNAEPGVATSFVQGLLKKDLEWAIKNGKITENSFGLFLKDCDRLIGQYGEIDTVALGAKYAQTAGKAVIAGVAVESLALLAQKAIHDVPTILNRLDDIWSGKEPELPKPNEIGVPGIDRGVDVFKEPEPSGDFKGVMTQELEYQGGKSIWQEAEKQLMSRFRIYVEGEGKESLEVLKTLNIDKIKDAIVDNPVKYGLDGNEDIDRLSVEKLQKIKWDLVFHDLEQKGAFASDLQKDGIPVFGLEEDGENILKNNETLRTFFAEHPDAPRTSENYENILKGKGDTGEVLENAFEIKDVKGRIEFENPYGIKIEAIDNKIEVKDVNNRILSTVLIEEGVGAERAINDAKIEAMHVINWSKADFENVVGKPNFELVDGKQAVFNGVIPGSSRISIDDAERAGINVFGKVGLDHIDRIKLNAWMENIKILDTPERAKLFFDLSNEIGVDYKSAISIRTFEKMPDDMTVEQSLGYMKIFAGGDVKGGIVNLLGMEGAYGEDVIDNKDVIEIKDLKYKGKVMDVYISKDGKNIGIESSGDIDLGVKKEFVLGWPPFKAVPEYEINGDTIAMLRERMKTVLGVDFKEFENRIKDIGQPGPYDLSIKGHLGGEPTLVMESSDHDIPENVKTGISEFDAASLSKDELPSLKDEIKDNVAPNDVEPKKISRETFELASKGKLEDLKVLDDYRANEIIRGKNNVTEISSDDSSDVVSQEAKRGDFELKKVDNAEINLKPDALIFVNKIKEENDIIAKFLEEYRMQYGKRANFSQFEKEVRSVMDSNLNEISKIKNGLSKINTYNGNPKLKAEVIIDAIIKKSKLLSTKEIEEKIFDEL